MCMTNMSRHVLGLASLPSGSSPGTQDHVLRKEYEAQPILLIRNNVLTVTANTESARMEPLLLREVQG